MSANRLEILRNLAAQNPNDTRTRYMLAMELEHAGDLESAVEEYQAIIAAEADYVAAYLPAGRALERLGLKDQARSLYQRGLEACRRAGDEHAKSKLQDRLDALG